MPSSLSLGLGATVGLCLAAIACTIACLPQEKNCRGQGDSSAQPRETFVMENLGDSIIAQRGAFGVKIFRSLSSQLEQNQYVSGQRTMTTGVQIFTLTLS